MGNALYDSFIADYYDASPLVSGRLQDVAFYKKCAQEYGGPVLELGCGTGRVTQAVAAAGVPIVGLDLSERMLEYAVKRRSALPPDVQERMSFTQGDMTSFDLQRQFRLAIVPFRPFQHLITVAEQVACLDCIRRHLAPGGTLILDVFQTDAQRIHDRTYAKESLVTEYRTTGRGRVRILERVAAFHRAAQCNDVEMIFEVRHPDGREERLVFAWTLRYFFRYEVEHLLARCGFRVTALYGDFDRSPLTDDSPEMIFVAEPLIQ